MAARAIWKALIRFEDVRLPVKLYSAVQDRGVHFNLLHDQDLVRVTQRLVNVETEETTSYSEAERAYEVERGLLVMLSKEELEALEPPASRDIQITRFVDPRAINHQWYDRPYYLGPDENARDYFAFSAALAAKGLEGVARWVMRRKQYVGALRAEGDYLMLITLRHSGEVISAADMEPPEGRASDAKERRLAEQLVEALEGKFKAQQFHDEYRERVLTLIEKKRRGESVEVPEYEEKPEQESLQESLRASLAMMK